MPDVQGFRRSACFLRQPESSATACWRRKGTGRCKGCAGKGQTKQPRFKPYVYVEGSRTMPLSITAAAFTGATWRYLFLSANVVARPSAAQRGWVSWRIQTHYRETGAGGNASCLGNIVRYWWRLDAKTSIPSDHRGGAIDEPASRKPSAKHRVEQVPSRSMLSASVRSPDEVFDTYTKASCNLYKLTNADRHVRPVLLVSFSLFAATGSLTSPFATDTRTDPLPWLSVPGQRAQVFRRRR